MKKAILVVLLLFTHSSHLFAESISVVKNYYLIASVNIGPQRLGSIVAGRLQAAPPDDMNDPEVTCHMIRQLNSTKPIPRGTVLKVKEIRLTEDKTVIKIDLEDASVFAQFWCDNSERQEITFIDLQSKLKGAFDLRKR